MPLFGPPNIEKLKAKRDVQGLIKGLSYPKEPGIRLDAAKALGQIGDSQAVEPLIAALKDSNIDVRKTVAEVLGKFGDGRAAAPLVNTLDDSFINEITREALVKIGSAAVEPLIALIEALRYSDMKWYVSMYAAEVLGRIGDTRAVEPLIALLKDNDEHVRYGTAEALGKIGDTRAVQPLIAALKDTNEHVRRASAQALVMIGDAREVQPLIAVLTGYELGYLATEALVKIGAPAVDPLIVALQNYTGFELDRIANALAEIGDARAVEPLKAVLMKHVDAAAFALEKLGWQPDQDECGACYWIAKKEWAKCVEIGALAVKPLVVSLGDWNEDVRKAAELSIGKIGTPAIEPLLNALLNGNRPAAWALEKLGWQPGHDRTAAIYWVAKQNWQKCIELGSLALGLLIDELRSDKSDIRAGAAHALGMIGDARAVEPLISMLENYDLDVRRNAAVALGEIGDARAVKPLLARLVHQEVEAVDALAKIGDPRVVSDMVNAANDYGSKTYNSDHNKYYVALVKALQKLFLSGKLDEGAKQAILALRADITQDKHIDEHVDRHADRDSRHCHYDNNYDHADHHIPGLDFPL